MSGAEPLWEPPKPSQPSSGHNQPPNGSSFQDDIDAVVRLGPIVTSFKRLGLAIRDPRCHKPHLRVLYNIMERLSRTKGTAFPDRKTIAADEDLADHTVENVLYDLRRWGHIEPIRDTKAVCTTSCRSPERQLRRAIYALRVKVPAPTGTQVPVPEERSPNGYSWEKVPSNGGKKISPWRVQ
jgi:hypothetical protein